MAGYVGGERRKSILCRRVHSCLPFFGNDDMPALAVGAEATIVYHGPVALNSDHQACRGTYFQNLSHRASSFARPYRIHLSVPTRVLGPVTGNLGHVPSRRPGQSTLNIQDCHLGAWCMNLFANMPVDLPANVPVNDDRRSHFTRALSGQNYHSLVPHKNMQQSG